MVARWPWKKITIDAGLADVKALRDVQQDPRIAVASFSSEAVRRLRGSAPLSNGNGAFSNSTSLVFASVATGEGFGRLGRLGCVC